MAKVIIARTLSVLIQSEWYKLSQALKPYHIKLSTRIREGSMKYGDAKKLIPPPGEQYHLPSVSDIDRWEKHVANDDEDVEVMELYLETEVL